MVDIEEAHVSYHSGATKLFLAVENQKWREVIDIVESEAASETEIWVCTENWRRLPLHEACRRQAPAWIVAALLAAHPQAAAARTQFGELPIHLAVGCSASPEVVNLLLVSHWESINACDQSGRNPLEILREAEIRDVLEHETVLESLERSQQTWDNLESQREAALESLRKQDEERLQAVQKQYTEELNAERDQVKKLSERLEVLERQASQTSTKEQELQSRIDRHSREKDTWAHEKSHLLNRFARLEGDYNQATKCRVALENIIKLQQNEIQAGRKTQQQLKAALLDSTIYTQRNLQQHMQATQHALQQMVDSFVDLQGVVDQQENDLLGQLKRFEIQIPIEEEKKVDPNLEPEADDEHIAAEVVAAASTVLKLESTS